MKSNTFKFLCVSVVALAALVALAACGGGGGGTAEPPVVSVLAGQVQAGSGGSLADVKDGDAVPADGTVKTGGDSRALLTYKDGSTVELEPGTEVSLAKGEGINLKLASGAAWAAANTFPVTIDAGGPVAASGKAMQLFVKKDGTNVTVSATGGDAKFTTGGNAVTVANGQTASSGGAPAATAFKGALRIVVEGEALVYLADPLGRAVGYHPTEETTTNQIPGSWYSSKPGRPQVISVLDPVPGKYTMILVAAANQSPWALKLGGSGTDLNYKGVEKSSSITWGTPTGIWFNVNADSAGAISVSDVSDIWTLYNTPPGKVALGEQLKRATIQTGQEPAWVQVGVKGSSGGISK